MLVQMELQRIIISDIRDHQVVFLHEVDGERTFPILIGIFEATSIDRRIKGEIPPRPLTHGLLRNVVEEMGGEVQDVVINSLQEHTYYALIRIRKDGELIQVDSRPSDAIALAVQYTPPLPIYVEDGGAIRAGRAEPEAKRAARGVDEDRILVARELVRDEAVGDQAAARCPDSERGKKGEKGRAAD